MLTTSTSFQIEKIIALPTFVESNAMLLEKDECLWLLINQTGNKKTQIYKVFPSLIFQFISSLPIIATTAVTCGEQITVSGANSTGQPFIIGINDIGQVIWEYTFQDLKPVTWPTVSCGDKPLFAFQQTQEKIEWGYLDTKSAELISKQSFSIDTPPVKFFPLKDKLLVGWSGKKKIHFLDLNEENEEVVKMNRMYTGNYSAQQSKEGIYYGWLLGNQAHLFIQSTKSLIIIPLNNSASSTFNLVAGGSPLIWAQHYNENNYGDFEWESTLILNKDCFFSIDGYVYSVIWWGRKIVMINQSKIILLKEIKEK